MLAVIQSPYFMVINLTAASNYKVYFSLSSLNDGGFKS